MKKIYLVDTENVHSVWVRFLSQMNPEDEMVLFYTNNSQGLSYSDLDALKEGNYNFHMVKCFTGRNGLDFQLSSYLGYLIKDSKDSEFYIIANDNGYDALVRFWNKQNVLVKRLNVDLIKKLSSDEKSLIESEAEKLLTAETTVTLETPSEPESQEISDVEVIKELDPVTVTVESKIVPEASYVNETPLPVSQDSSKETRNAAKSSMYKPNRKGKEQTASKVVRDEAEKKAVKEDVPAKAPIQYKVMNPLWGELQASKKEANEKKQAKASISETETTAEVKPVSTEEKDNIVKDITSSKEVTSNENKSSEKTVSAKEKASNKKNVSSEKIVPAEKKASDVKKVPVEKKASDVKEVPAEKKASDVKKVPAKKKASDEKKVPAEKKASDVKKAPAERVESAKKRTATKKSNASKKVDSAAVAEVPKETSGKSTADHKEEAKAVSTKKAPIKNKAKALTIIKDATKDCSFKITNKDHLTILHVLAYECPEHDLRTINNRLVKAFEQEHGSELYKTLKQAKAITEVYRLID